MARNCGLIGLATLCVSGLASVAGGVEPTAYVNTIGHASPDLNDLLKPFHMIEAAACALPDGGVIDVQSGNYREPGLVIDQPVTVTAHGGVAVLGVLPAASTTFRVASYNTHLFGDNLVPTFGGEIWEDDERAVDIGDWFAEHEPGFDLVGFQELWDGGLFVGDAADDQTGIWPESGYAYGFQDETTACPGFGEYCQVQIDACKLGCSATSDACRAACDTFGAACKLGCDGTHATCMAGCSIPCCFGECSDNPDCVSCRQACHTVRDDCYDVCDFDCREDCRLDCENDCQNSCVISETCMTSGLALMSPHTLLDPVQQIYGSCALIDCFATKAWVAATIQKDGFTVRVFNTHLQAFDSEDEIAARENQILSLRAAVDQYRSSFRTHAVFVIGDFNVLAERPSQYYFLRDVLGAGGGRDAAPNHPCVFVPGEDFWTVSDQNELAVYFDDETFNARLDYIFYFPSYDGTVDVLPEYVAPVDLRGRTRTSDGLTTDRLSDHYAVVGDFTLVRK
jgi:hypothetical protein